MTLCLACVYCCPKSSLAKKYATYIGVVKSSIMWFLHGYNYDAVIMISKVALIRKFQGVTRAQAGILIIGMCTFKLGVPHRTCIVIMSLSEPCTVLL